MASLDPLVLVDALETRVHLELLEAWDLLVAQVYQDPQARLDHLVHLVREENEEKLDLLE